MTVRHQEISRYNTSQGPSTEYDKKPEKVKVLSRVSGMHNSGIEPDTLHSALGLKNIPILPSDNTQYIHTRRVKPTGAHYNPTESYRKVKATQSRDGRGYSYGGAPNKKGDNPLGRNLNRKGDNPLGRAMNRVGTNVLGRPTNRSGANPLGNNSNRTGQKSGYPSFSPRGAGRNV